MQDFEIVELYFARDERAIAETERKYGKLCHKLANRIIGDEQDAEECVNDTYLGLWQAIPPQKPNSLCAFAAKIVRNLAISRLKYRNAAKRNAGVILSLSELDEVIPDTAGFEDIDDGAIGRWISEFLYEQTQEVRNIFIRKYWCFDSVAELSGRFGYSEEKIKSILFRTRKKLREHLTRKGVAL